MPDWLEFDPPGVESNRATMFTEEKKCKSLRVLPLRPDRLTRQIGRARYVRITI